MEKSWGGINGLIDSIDPLLAGSRCSDSPYPTYPIFSILPATISFIIIMFKSLLLTHYSTYRPKLESQNQALLHSPSPKERYTIDKAELIGQKLIEILFLQLGFLERSEPLPEPLFKIVMNRVYPLMEQKATVDKKLIKRTVCKLFAEGRYSELQQIKSELAGLIEAIIQQRKGESSLSVGKEISYTSNRLQTHQPNSLNNSLNLTSFISNLNSSQHSQQPQKPKDTFYEIRTYLQKQVRYSKTQLTQFCHQFKIREPVYQKVDSNPNTKSFECKCTIVIPKEELHQFSKAEYSDSGEGLNTKNSTAEAAKKVLFKIYSENPKVWGKFKEIKVKKSIST